MRLPKPMTSLVTTSTIESLLRRQIPGFSPDKAAVLFGQLGVDSFGMIELRADVELATGRALPDSVWMEIETPAQLVAWAGGQRVPPVAPAQPANLHRDYVLNMPQMALGGLSESWLFKELGDAHWDMINSGLGVPSSSLADGNGDRLYATLTRVRLEASAPMAAFGENERMALEGRISRLGSGMFFSDVAFSGAGKGIRASVMSSFTKRGSPASNTGLVRGQPTIPPGCPIPVLNSMPDLGVGYKTQRNTTLGPTLFETEYRIIPYHDINGVGLLYFAAYPNINDICELEYMGRSSQWAFESSTVSRDIFYFANTDAQERLKYRVHSQEQTAEGVRIESSLSRVSDGVLMAYIVTNKSVMNG
jgi:probable biosynthetic protein (TIGR04098 family)